MPSMSMRAAFVDERGDGTPVCGLCPHRCAIAPGKLGICLTRQNEAGTLVVTTYGRLHASAVDPIEKKPLFHYRPGSRTFSVASMGCNLTCPFCQNHSLSRGLDEPGFSPGVFRSPDQIVESAVKTGCDSIAFTYSEPILMFEFARDVAKKAAPRGIELAYVTNGQATRQAAEALGQFIHAANVDLKSHSKTQYREQLGGSLKATLDTIGILVRRGVWVEVTTLVIPGFNDSDEALTKIARFIVDIDPSIPWHVSRFHPAHLWTACRPTPVATLRRAREIGLGLGLKYVYTGNLLGDTGEQTGCPGCGATVIDRYGFNVTAIETKNGQCPHCGEPIAGRGLP